ncbi:MAG: DinB family protein [Longimicrobiales bacterium]
MRSELQEVIEDFERARARLRQLAATIEATRWFERPDPARWSAGECVIHLNRTGEAFLPLLHEGLERAKRLQPLGARRLRRDPIGWLLWRIMPPPVRLRTGTASRFVPASGGDPVEVLATFERLQDEQVACAAAARGLPIDRVKLTSPFNARVRYNLYAALGILPRHQHRHLWQAEQVVRALR